MLMMVSDGADSSSGVYHVRRRKAGKRHAEQRLRSGFRPFHQGEGKLDPAFRIQEAEERRLRLYEDYKAEILDDDEYSQLKEHYIAEKQRLEHELQKQRQRVIGTGKENENLRCADGADARRF